MIMQHVATQYSMLQHGVVHRHACRVSKLRHAAHEHIHASFSTPRVSTQSTLEYLTASEGEYSEYLLAGSLLPSKHDPREPETIPQGSARAALENGPTVLSGRTV